MRARPRMLVAASFASLVVGALGGVTAPEAQAAGAVLAPQSAVSTISPMSTPLSWNETKANRVVEIARRYAGFPYIRGNNGPYAFDCSNYTRHVYAQIGVHLSPKPNIQATSGPRIPASQAQPGDLVWWPGHVGIYTGNGQHIAARNPTLGIQEGPVYGNPVYIRVIPSGMGF